LYPSPHILRVIKPWKMNWVKHVARMTGGSNTYPKDRNYLENNIK